MSTDHGEATATVATDNVVEPLLLDVDQAAARLGISRRSLYRLVDGGAPHRRLKGVRGVKFASQDLEQIVAGSAVQAPAVPARRARRAS